MNGRAVVATTIFIGYLAIGVFTFGHAATHCPGCDAVDRWPVGMVNGAFWPLYWSWTIQEKWR